MFSGAFEFARHAGRKCDATFGATPTPTPPKTRKFCPKYYRAKLAAVFLLLVCLCGPSDVDGGGAKSIDASGSDDT